MIKLELSELELQVVGAALKQMPYHMVAAIIENIGNQVSAQQKSNSSEE
ncbi:hypothetical protein ACR3LR_08585 [Pantoea eucalypti]